MDCHFKDLSSSGGRSSCVYGTFKRAKFNEIGAVSTVAVDLLRCPHEGKGASGCLMINPSCPIRMGALSSRGDFVSVSLHVWLLDLVNVSR